MSEIDEYTPLEIDNGSVGSPRRFYSMKRLRTTCCYIGIPLLVLSFVIYSLYSLIVENTTSNSSVITNDDNNMSISNSPIYSAADISVKVATLEHEVIYSSVSSTTAARTVMYANINKMTPYIKNASVNGVKLLLLPEFGLTGLVNYLQSNPRTAIYYYLEQLPSANKVVICNNSSYSSKPIFQTLSCLAKNYSLYLSVNWGDYVNCSNTTDKSCPSDGRYQYNTQLVFSDSGAFIAKYYKMHLFNEAEYNTPSDNPTYFNFTYGGNTHKIGIFTCFDTMYPTPLWNLIKTYNISTFLLSHWWVNLFPTSSSNQWFESLSRTYNINLITSGNSWSYNGSTYKASSGSGIYSKGYIVASYYNYFLTASDKLLMGNITLNNINPTSSMIINNFYYKNLTSIPAWNITYLGLGYAVPNGYLSGTINGKNVSCSVKLYIDTVLFSDYWYLMLLDGYYNVGDGSKRYYYDQMCAVYKYTGVYVDYSNTKVKSIELRAKFDRNATVFIEANGQYGDVYTNIMTKTNYTNYKNGSIVAYATPRDYLLDFIIFGRVYKYDAALVS